MFDPMVTYDDLVWIKAQRPGKIVVKGVQNVEDARRLADPGVDGITLSNHGGILSGADIVASVALGARFTMIGRAYLYGLMSGGRDGVDRTIPILKDEVARTMKLLGVSTLEELNPSHVTQLVRLAPHRTI